MVVRMVEGERPYTGGDGIEINANKVISLLLREENNLIKLNNDNEVYTDLQLASNITPNSNFPVGVTVGRVLQSDGWTKSGLMLNWKTTSGDYARWIYATDGKLYFDNGTGVWKNVYYSSEVDELFDNIAQSDWAQTNPSAPDYIKNKPIIEQPNDGTLTIQKNGATLGTFTANQSTDSIVNISVPTVIDNTISTSTISALSANQGKNLQEQINNLKAIGRFLSLWNASTGLPISFPEDTPYEYNTGDYFMVEVVADDDGTNEVVNYRPSGSTYTNTASSVVETEEVKVGDMYIYDGSIWLLQLNHGKSVSFTNLAGDPNDNVALASALNGKQDKLTAGDGIIIGQKARMDRGPCENGFHIPTSNELETGVYNKVVALGISSNSGTPWQEYLKIPLAGTRSYTGEVDSQGEDVVIRTSSTRGNALAYVMLVSPSQVAISYTGRIIGCVIRPMKDEAVAPDNSWTTIFDGSSVASGAGIFRNQTEGLISISANGTNWTTIADKNLGATTVYNYGDTLSEANCGKYYQWGNNYGFSWSGTLAKTSSEKVDTTGYGNGNYYSSDTYITGVYGDWASPYNNSLWSGGEFYEEGDTIYAIADSSLSSASTNPVQNKVINSAIESLQNDMGTVYQMVDDRTEATFTVYDYDFSDPESSYTLEQIVSKASNTTASPVIIYNNKRYLLIRKIGEDAVDSECTLVFANISDTSSTWDTIKLVYSSSGGIPQSLTAGTMLVGSEYSAGNGIDITNNVISASNDTYIYLDEAHKTNILSTGDAYVPAHGGAFSITFELDPSYTGANYIFSSGTHGYYDGRLIWEENGTLYFGANQTSTYKTAPITHGEKHTFIAGQVDDGTYSTFQVLLDGVDVTDGLGYMGGSFTSGFTIGFDGYEQSGGIVQAFVGKLYEVKFGDFTTFSDVFGAFYPMYDGVSKKYTMGAEIYNRWYSLTKNDGYWNGNNITLGMQYPDFDFKAYASTNAITLSLSTTHAPNQDFTVNAPSTILNGMTYLLRVTNASTAYTMTLGTGITNPYGVSTTLTANQVDCFRFLAVEGNLELQPNSITKSSSSPLDIKYFWAGTQAQYDALSSYSDDTVYLTV